MKHPTEEQLILYRYGELDAPLEAIQQHLVRCNDCRSDYERLRWVLATVSEQPVPERSEEYPSEVWSRLQPHLAKTAGPGRREVTGWFGMPRWAALAAVAALVLAAFIAGRFWPGHPTQAPEPVSAQVRDRILLVAVDDHLERSQMVLVELVNTQATGEVDISREQRRAEDLLADNRLYRQTAMRVGEPGLANLLDELERVLTEVVNSPAEVSARELQSLRRRIEDQGILFKMRVVGTEVERREQRSGKQPSGLQGLASPPEGTT